jgi:membrane-bound metal-dependent hydrolase YbcI (DUF457 family)
MDLLTHLFLPLTVAYVLRPDLFDSPWHLALAGFAVAPDLDKLLGLQGAFHSAITLGVAAAALVALERRRRDDATYAVLIAALLYSHLLLDVLDGGPVTLLYPLVDVGIGLRYPAQLVVGDTVSATGIRNPLPSVHAAEPTRGHATYSLVNGYGVLSALTFVVVYLGSEYSALALPNQHS